MFKQLANSLAHFKKLSATTHGDIRPATVSYSKGDYKLTDNPAILPKLNQYARVLQGEKEACFLPPELLLQIRKGSL